MKAKRADHPQFHQAWEDLQKELGHVLSISHHPGADRQLYDSRINAAVAALEHLKTLIPAPTLAVGQKVRITLNNGYLGKNATVLQLAGLLARVIIHDRAKTETAYHITDLEPVDPNL